MIFLSIMGATIFIISWVVFCFLAAIKVSDLFKENYSLAFGSAFITAMTLGMIPIAIMFQINNG